MKKTSKPKKLGRRPDGIKRAPLNLLVHVTARNEFVRKANESGRGYAGFFNYTFSPPEKKA